MDRNSLGTGPQLLVLLLLLLHQGSVSQAAVVVATAAAPTTPDSSAAEHELQCVLGALICLHADLKPFLVTALWLLFLAVMLLVFERSEQRTCGVSSSEPSSSEAPGSSRSRARRVRVFCVKVCIRGVRDYLPTSCLQILLGLLFAGAVEFSGYHVAHLEELEPNLFFRFLLPIIIINAGLGVEKAHFFFNLPAILAYAVLGTIIVALLVGYPIYWLAAMNPGPFTILKNVTKLEALTFGALISAVDPVAVLALFERMHLNKPLYITLFGESVLNDAVSVVLYNLFTKAGASMPANATEWRPTTQEVAGTALYSAHVALTGLVIGVACGLLASGLLRVLPNAGNQHLAVIIVVVFGYISFYLAEFVAASGILSTFICAMVMSIYFANLTPISYAFLRQSTKSYAEISEGFIYLVLGVSALKMLFSSSAKAIVDVPFIFITLLLCLVLRFACVYGIGYLLRALHLTDLRAGDFFILAYGGLRGAIALSLSLMLREERRRFADVFLTCAMVIVLLTCFIYGITLKPLITAMKIQSDTGDEDDGLFDQQKRGASDPLRHRPLTRRLYFWMNDINNRYLKRALLKSKVYQNELHSMLKIATETESLADLNGTQSNPTIYVIRKGNSRGTLSQGSLSSVNKTPHESVADVSTLAGDNSVPDGKRGSQGQRQLPAKPQVLAHSRLNKTPYAPIGARLHPPGARGPQPPPPLQLLTANSVGAKFFLNSGYNADEADFLESQKPPESRPVSHSNGGNHRRGDGDNGYTNQGFDVNSKSSGLSSIASNLGTDSSGKKDSGDFKRQRPRGGETIV